MKRILLFAIALFFGVALIAQNLKYSNPKHLRGQAVPNVAIDNPLSPQQTGNALTQSKSTLEDIIGDTRYDAQSNATIDNRLIVWPDGTISAAWTKAQLETSYTDRGTGYNYYNGTSWGPAPTARIETIRTGWPTMDKWKGNGEIVIAHQSGTAPMTMNTRPVKGTGSWTQTLIASPPPCTGLLWPRVMTSGPTNTYVHMLALTAPTGNGGVKYMGMDGCLLYYRSLDGGATWDKSAVILPGMDSINQDAYNGDQYSWGSPHGDTIYFGVSGPWTDSFIMKSTDNGTTWAKIPVLRNANKKLPVGTTDMPPFYAGDGAVAVEMDHSGVIHMAFGKGGGYMAASAKYIYVNVNGLIYWNTTMPMVQDSLILDSLDVHGNLLGYVFDGPNPGDTIVAAPSYRVGLSSHPQISVDAYNNIYCLYSAVTPGNPSLDPYNYRHIWGRAKFHDKGVWTDMMDFNEGVLYMFAEFAFPNMAKDVLNNNLHVFYQTSPQPGSAVQVTTIPVHDNNIEHRVIPVSDFWPTGIKDNQGVGKNVVSQNFPNPTHGTTSFNVTLSREANVTVDVFNVMGQKVISMDKGLVNAGITNYTIDCTSLNAGIFFYTVKINGESFTRKMIVE
ncbi:MAG: T9SS type A sorting domain-containing protein [Bacteroidota bacterium]